MSDRPNYITPAGYSALAARYRELMEIERPKVVEVVSWAAGNGDRSENGDYLYGRKRLREIDGEANRISRKIKTAKVIDPAQAEDRSRAWFGATVTVVDQHDQERVLTLVGEDEADASSGRISWQSPLAQALKGAAIGDTRRVVLPAGAMDYDVIAIDYPAMR